MNEKTWLRILIPFSGNRKSASGAADQKRPRGPKWVGIFAIALTVVFGGVLVEAQQAKKITTIGYLSSGNTSSESARSEAIRRALRELGYVEGQNITTEYRYSEGKTDRAAELAAELVRLKADVIIVAGGFHWIRAAKTATKTIPIIMVGAGNDPVEAGLIESLARPGANVTGLTNLDGKLAGKRLEFLKAGVPKAARIAVIYEPATPANVLEVKEDLPNAARALKLALQTWEVRNASDFDKLFATLRKQRPDGFYVAGSPLLNAHRQRVVGFALESRLPSMSVSREAVEAGGLMSYGPELGYSYGRVAVYVDKILKGASPADLPVEQPRRFELVVNLSTAKQIGLTVPPNVLARADRILK